VVVAPRKLIHVPECLLEVVTDQLVRAVPSIETPRRVFMQFRAARLGDPAIGHVAHEYVVEAEEILFDRMNEASLRKSKKRPRCIFPGREVAELVR
jgi:hypothetical protein